MVTPPPSTSTLREWIEDANARNTALVEDLDAGQLQVPLMPIVTPFVWELAHVAWFQEFWVLRGAYEQEPREPGVDQVYDSRTVPHDDRWTLPQMTREQVLAYQADVRDRQLAALAAGEPDERQRYFLQLGVFHSDMHAEAFTYMRQTLALPRPSFCAPAEPRPCPCPQGDVEVAGADFELGARRDEPFVFDNEKWEHHVRVEPFRIARCCVTQGEYRAFVEDGGYARQALWCDAGWFWRQRSGATHPVYWRQTAGGWERRDFDRWLPLDPELPVHHVNWYEASAFCRWAKRRLPSEAEWELAAGGPEKRRYPWGEEPPTCERANLEWQRGGCGPAADYEAGTAHSGCCQMLGNVWEWTATTFAPYPGFVIDPYKEYSSPFFGRRKVLRGGSWATTARLLRNTWRNYFEPWRRDIVAGFRTCALDA